ELSAADGHYVEFLERLSHLPADRHPYLAMPAPFAPHTMRTRALLLASIPHVPEPLRSERFALVTTLMVGRLAVLRQDGERGAPAGEQALALANLLDALTALFTVESSPPTRAALSAFDTRHDHPAHPKEDTRS